MFTGIVEEVGKVRYIQLKKPDLSGHSDFLDHPGRLRSGQKKYSVEPGSETVLR